MVAQDGGRPPRPEGRLPERKKRARETKRGKGGVIAFLLVSAVPVGAIGWYLMQSAETQQKITDVFAGSGGRAAKAGICLVVLIVLAKIALPAFHATSAALTGVMARMRERKIALRIVTFPIYAVVWFVWLASQMLFAIDAVLILATGAILIVLAIRIVDPSVLQTFIDDNNLGILG